MNNSYITIIKEKRTALSRKRIPLNQNGCTANFRIGVPFEQNLHGHVLYRIVDDAYKGYNNHILEFMIERLKHRNCKIIINEKNIL